MTKARVLDHSALRSVVHDVGFDYEKPDFGLVEWMPSIARGHRVSTALYDTTDGRLVALCEATFPTALRTGAASAAVHRP